MAKRGRKPGSKNFTIDEQIAKLEKAIQEKKTKKILQERADSIQPLVDCVVQWCATHQNVSTESVLKALKATLSEFSDSYESQDENLAENQAEMGA